jgi:RNA polymerase sigma-70 factor (ECF subfamily)
LSGVSTGVFLEASESDAVGLSRDEIARVLIAVGDRCNYGMPAVVAASREQVAAFLRSLQLRDLALAHACTLGRDAGWRRFISLYRGALTQMAVCITGSASVGNELADSLYSAMFGVSERGDIRRSPLAYYSGRGSLKGFLRATLAQRHVDYQRREGREEPLPDSEPMAAPDSPGPSPDLLSRLGKALHSVMANLEAEERFLLSSWFLDQRTLLEISRILRVHEATVSRRMGRLTARLHTELLAALAAGGMSRADAEESLGTHPGDIDINLRGLLQGSRSGAFSEQSSPPRPERI